jgi:hypothetical protein
MSGGNQPGADREPMLKLFRRTRGGVALTREEVKYIKAERKKLRKQMRAAGLKSKYDFETTASSLGLYFDKRSGIFAWLFRGKGMWLLVGAALLVIGALLAMAAVSQMRGYFTINLSDRLFRNGFVLSETEDFENPVTNLFCEPQVDVPCISITSLPADIDEYEGQHNGFGYFAYTYFVRNEGEDTVDYSWELQITGESLEASTAAWIMVFEDGEMVLYAESDADGWPQAVPERDDDTRGFLEIPVMEMAADPSELMEPVKTVGDMTYYRITPVPFEDEDTVAIGEQTEVAPEDVHKYTIVVWLEGDDPDCTDERIGGHLGLNMQYMLLEELEEEGSFWDRLWDSLKFWEE